MPCFYHIHFKMVKFSNYKLSDLNGHLALALLTLFCLISTRFFVILFHVFLPLTFLSYSQILKKFSDYNHVRTNTVQLRMSSEKLFYFYYYSLLIIN